MFRGKVLAVKHTEITLFFLKHKLCFSFPLRPMYVISIIVFLFQVKKFSCSPVIKQRCRNLSLQCESINYCVTSCADFRPPNHPYYSTLRGARSTKTTVKPSVSSRQWWSEGLPPRNGLD